jgi:hypothetical protein
MHVQWLEGGAHEFSTLEVLLPVFRVYPRRQTVEVDVLLLR